MAWLNTTTHRWSIVAGLTALAVLGTGLVGQPPAAAEGFGHGIAQVTTVVEGTGGVDEVQQFELDGTGGTFTLEFDGETTGPIAFGSPAVEVEAALVDLATVGPGAIGVSRLPNVFGGVRDNGDDPYVLSFGGGLGARDVGEVTPDAAGLIGPAPDAVSVTTTLGKLPTNEVQQLRVRAFEGTYTITFDGHTTGPLAFNLSAGALQAALEAFPAIDPGDVVVTGGPGNGNGSKPYTATFSGDLALTDVAPFSTDADALVFAVAGATLAELPAFARPTAWSTVTGQVVGILESTADGWSWTPEGGYVALPRWGDNPFVPVDVNDHGLVVGNSATSGGSALLWSAAEGVQSLETGAAVAVNNQGAVVGRSGHEPFVWTEETGTVLLGTLPTETAPSTPGHPRGQDPDAWAADINNAGQVIGYSTVGPGYFLHSFLWTAEGGMVDLGTLGFDGTYDGGEPGTWATMATDINDAGVVVGSSRPAVPGPGEGPASQHPFVWTEAGGMVDLGIGSGRSELVNEAGQVAGGHEVCVVLPDDTDCVGHGFVWSAAGGAADVEGDINVLSESGAALGTASYGPPHYAPYTFYWDPEVGMVDVGNPSFLVASAASQPFALSETGEILAFSNLPPPDEAGARAETDEPVGIVYWPNAGPGQPDQTIRRSSQTVFGGSRVYNRTGAGQTRSSSNAPGSTATFVVRTQNTGAASARFTLRGRSSGNGFQVRYLVGGHDVTASIVAGTYRTPRTAPRGYQDLKVRVTVARSTPVGRTAAVTVKATSSNDTTRTDTVKANVRVIGN